MVFTALRTRLTTYFSPRAPKSSAGNAAIGTRVQSGRVTKNPQATRESVTDHEGTPTDRGGAKASRDRGDHRVSPGGSKTSSQPAGVETNYLMSGGLSGSAPANHKVGAHQVDDFSDDPSTPRRKTPEVGRGKGKQVKRARQDSEDSDSDVNPPKKKPTTKAKGKATPAKGKGKATPKKSAPKSTKSAATPSKAKPAGKGKAAAKPRAKTPAKETVPEGAQPDSIPAEKKQLGKATPKKAARKHDEVEPDDVSEDKRPAKIAKTEQSQLARDNNAKGEEPVASIPIGYKDWTDNEVDLFNELNDRGFRPLLTDTWTLDFPTLPLNLFCDDDAEVLIKPIHGTSFRASKALLTLLDTGVLVRDRLLRRLTPEPVLNKAISTYEKWSLVDARLNTRAYIPGLSITTMGPQEDVPIALDRLTDQLRTLGRRYRDEWLIRPSTERSLVAPATNTTTTTAQESSISPQYSRPLPTLYGLLVAHTTVSLLCHNPLLPDNKLRLMATFNFKKPDQDVWNALAMAILIVWVREGLVYQDAPLLEVREAAKDAEEDL